MFNAEISHIDTSQQSLKHCSAWLHFSIYLYITFHNILLVAMQHPWSRAETLNSMLINGPHHLVGYPWQLSTQNLTTTTTSTVADRALGLLHPTTPQAAVSSYPSWHLLRSGSSSKFGTSNSHPRLHPACRQHQRALIWFDELVTLWLWVSWYHRLTDKV